MRLPLSPQTLLRLHRKLFMLRRPRALARNAYSLTLAQGRKSPIVRLRVEKNRSPMLGILLAALSLLLALRLAINKN